MPLLARLAVESNDVGVVGLDLKAWYCRATEYSFREGTEAFGYAAWTNLHRRSESGTVLELLAMHHSCKLCLYSGCNCHQFI